MVHFLEHVGWPYGQWACLCHVCGVLGCMLWAFWPVGGHVRQVSRKGCMLWSVLGGLLGNSLGLIIIYTYLHIKATISLCMKHKGTFLHFT